MGKDFIAFCKGYLGSLKSTSDLYRSCNDPKLSIITELSESSSKCKYNKHYHISSDYQSNPSNGPPKFKFNIKMQAYIKSKINCIINLV